MVLTELFGEIKSAIFFKGGLIDNTTFRLHYQFTFIFLIVASVLQSCKQYFGDPIKCIVNGVPEEVFETYCWIHGTFTLPSQLAGNVGLEVPHPGVGAFSHFIREKNNDTGLVDILPNGDQIRHAWYQWVVFILAFQALLCYFPHLVWKILEGGRIKLLLQDFKKTEIHTDEECHRSKRDVIAKYILHNMQTHNPYASKFVFCEFLNLANVCFQMWLMDHFFNGHFSNYGIDVLSISNQDPEKRVDPMAKIFPKMTKCSMHLYGPSGTIQNMDGLCVLPLNIINEKIYVFLWFWFVILISWTITFFIFRLITIFSRQSRYLVFCGRTKSSRREDVALISRKLWFGDWFILMQLCKNMHPEVFRDLVIDLRNRIDTKYADNLEMRNGANPYPTLPMMEKPQAPAYIETP